jgi:uncharacterized protein YndB with AHSA1/START domain
MTERSVTYNTFTIERRYPAAPARVFSAFADAEAKARWTNSPDEEPAGGTALYVEFDFRVGGRERFGFKESDGRTMAYDALYYDIVPEQRIVYSYEMCADDARISVSVATIEFVKEAAGTVLTWTEQGAYLDGLDQPALREGGTTWMLDNMTEYLASQAERP